MNIDRTSFHTGIPLIDRQHDEYLANVDALFQLCEGSHVEQSTIDEALKKALFYAIEHFDAEESLMLSVKYPAYEAHRVKHDEYRNRVDELCATTNENAGTPEERLRQLTKWLLEWFLEQTLIFDRKLAYYLKEHGHISVDA